MFVEFDNINIKGIVSVVPTKVEAVEEFVELLGEKRIKKQVRMTGVQQRHIEKEGQFTADLCITAAKRLMDSLQWKPEDIKVLILVTQNPSLIIPSTAFVIQKYLGISSDCLVFDVNLGCSGFVTGMQIISSMMQGLGEGTKGLLLTGEVQYNPFYLKAETSDEIADLMLFGSCGAATAVELNRESSKTNFDVQSNGERYDVIIRRYAGKNTMDGEAVFEFALNDVIRYLTAFMKKADINDKIDYYIFHQAQKFLLKNIALNLGIDEEKMLYSLKNYGNTSSASIPLTMCLHKELFCENRKVMLCGFGIGLSCASMSTTISSDVYFELLESDEIYPM